MKTSNPKYLMLALFATLAMNTSWNLYNQSDHLGTIELASETAAGDEDESRFFELTVEGQSESKETKATAVISAQITSRMGTSDEVTTRKIMPDAETEASSGVANMSGLMSYIRGANKPESAKAKKERVVEIILTKKGCNCLYQKEIVPAKLLKDPAAITAFITSRYETKVNAIAEEKEAKNKAEKERLALKKKEEKCEAHGDRDLTHKDFKLERAQCIVDRIDTIADKREAKRFWRKNKKYINKMITSNNADEMEEGLELLDDFASNNWEDEDLGAMAQSMYVMAEAGRTRSSIITNGYQLAHLRQGDPQRNFLINAIDNALLKFNGTRYRINSGEANSTFMSWDNNLLGMGNLAVDNPAAFYSKYRAAGTSIMLDGDSYLAVGNRARYGLGNEVFPGFAKRTRLSGSRKFLNNLPLPAGIVFPNQNTVSFETRGRTFR